MPIFLLLLALALADFSARAASTNYAGLVYSGIPNTGNQSGRFDMSVSANRKFSGRMFIGSRSAGFSGRFDTNGTADIVVKMTTDNSCYGCDPVIIDVETQKLWDVHFQLSPGGDTISGGLHFRQRNFPDGTLSGKRSSFSRANPVPATGKFTFVLPGSGDPANTNSPTGNSFGTASIDASGNVHLSGSLAEKSAFSQGTLLCNDGTIPVFDSFYNAKGMLQGWLGLTNSPATDMNGNLLWVKTDFTDPKFFPAGFTNELAAVGSRYVRANPVLDWSNGVVIFQGGKLTAPFTNAVILNAKSKVANLSNNKLTLKINLDSGRFNGSANEPSTGDGISFNGVLLQKQNIGLGFFPDAPLSGQVFLGPTPP
jgi:hypothetical protein